MKRYRIIHTTTYGFTDTVSLCKAEAHLIPRDLPHQHCELHQLVTRPLAEEKQQWEDAFGNQVTYFEVSEPHQTLDVTAISVVRVDPSDNPPKEESCVWNEVSLRLEKAHSKGLFEAQRFVAGSKCVKADADLADYALVSFTQGRPVLEATHHLMERIHEEFTYYPGSTTTATSINEALIQRRGVCQDFAHLAIGCLRSLGLAARYVSGYLDTAALRGPHHVIASDASHAWFSVYDPVLGWVDFDPTVGRMPPEGYITTAWGRDYDDVAPLKGTFTGGGPHTLNVSVDVARV
jgi:transglutaminase-like putative cysteine protease